MAGPSKRDAQRAQVQPMQVIIGIYHHLVLGLHESEIRWIAGSSFNPPSTNILQARRLVVSSCTHQTDWLALHNKRGMSMPDRIKIEFAKIQQDRSKRTLDDILEAASNLIEQADPDLFTSRILAVESGYSLGTLNKRLISVENVFIWLIEKGQKSTSRSQRGSSRTLNPHHPCEFSLNTLLIRSSMQ